MSALLRLGDLDIEVVRKDIKNVHLSVHPPLGRLRIAAPRHLSDDAIRSFVIGKLAWIRRQRRSVQEQDREPRREYLDRETHYVWGRRVLLRVVATDGAPRVEATPKRLILYVRRDAPEAKRAALVEEWYRAQVREMAPQLISRWAPVLGVTVARFFVQRMKTKWGSCNQRSGTIRLNTELARKPMGCLEYLVLHELVHLVEPTHNARFLTLMNAALPSWRTIRHVLNRLPVRHEDWEY